MNRYAIMLGTTAVLLPAALLAQAAAPDAAENWAAIARCAQADGAEARHACLDAVLTRTGLLGEGVLEAETRESFGETPRFERRQEQQAEAAQPQPAPAPVVPSPPPAAPAGTPAAPPPPPPPPPTPPAQQELDELETTVSNSIFAADRRVILFTPEKQTWKQTDGERLRLLPQEGSKLTISKAALGSFRCRLGKYVSFRCERLQ